MLRFLPLPFALLLAAGSADASGSTGTPNPLITSSEGFLNAHPDMKYRHAGMEAYRRGEHAQAMTHFRRAARFADKPSQGMIAEMLWSGDGVEQDRAAAYAWMDLAAEREYRVMLIRREVYWEALRPDERDRAIVIGQSLYADYGDAVAQPRLHKRMRSAKASTTGSRTGFVGTLTIQFDTPAGPVTIDGSSYYHPDLWDPKRYWAWQERHWKVPPRGVVDIGPLQSGAATDAEPEKE